MTPVLVSPGAAGSLHRSGDVTQSVSPLCVGRWQGWQQGTGHREPHFGAWSTGGAAQTPLLGAAPQGRAGTRHAEVRTRWGMGTGPGAQHNVPAQRQGCGMELKG